MPLPFEPPVAPMLARLRPEIPAQPGWLYEPKWDGFRCIVYRDSDSVQLQSRDGKPPVRHFPEPRGLLFPNQGQKRFDLSAKRKSTTAHVPEAPVALDPHVDVYSP